jgi:hypothetical protein
MPYLSALITLAMEDLLVPSQNNPAKVMNMLKIKNLSSL